MVFNLELLDEVGFVVVVAVADEVVIVGFLFSIASSDFDDELDGDEVLKEDESIVEQDEGEEDDERLEELVEEELDDEDEEKIYRHDEELDGDGTLTGLVRANPLVESILLVVVVA